MIHSNLLNPVRTSPQEVSLGGPLSAPPNRRQNHNQKISATTAIHFSNILKYILVQKEEGRKSVTSAFPGLEGGFQENGGRWGEIIIPDFATLP